MIPCGIVSHLTVIGVCRSVNELLLSYAQGLADIGYHGDVRITLACLPFGDRGFCDIEKVRKLSLLQTFLDSFLSYEVSECLVVKH